jgi:DNA-binding CsgD family transcriptional regulator
VLMVDPVHLTRTELAVVALVALGMTDRQAARSLQVSSNTIAKHLAAALQRSGARSRTELVARCLVSGSLTAAWPPAPSGKGCVSSDCACQIENGSAIQG